MIKIWSLEAILWCINVTHKIYLQWWSNFIFWFPVSQKLFVLEQFWTLRCDRGDKITPSNLFSEMPGQYLDFQNFAATPRRNATKSRRGTDFNAWTDVFFIHEKFRNFFSDCPIWKIFSPLDSCCHFTQHRLFFVPNIPNFFFLLQYLKYKCRPMSNSIDLKMIIKKIRIKIDRS